MTITGFWDLRRVCMYTEDGGGTFLRNREIFARPYIGTPQKTATFATFTGVTYDEIFMEG
jgi:hypothetical protein